MPTVYAYPTIGAAYWHQSHGLWNDTAGIFTNVSIDDPYDALDDSNYHSGILSSGGSVTVYGYPDITIPSFSGIISKVTIFNRISSVAVGGGYSGCSYGWRWNKAGEETNYLTSGGSSAIPITSFNDQRTINPKTGVAWVFSDLQYVKPYLTFTKTTDLPKGTQSPSWYATHLKIEYLTAGGGVLLI